MGAFIAKILAALAPRLSSAIQKTDGKKTVSGAIITALGAGCLAFESLFNTGIGLISTGVPLMFGGVAHKVVKHKRKKGEKQWQESKKQQN